MFRELSPEQADQLQGGDDHYRAYVGPPERYGPLALSQMALLTALSVDRFVG